MADNCTDCECKPTVTEDDSCLDGIFEFKNAKCFSWQSLFVQLICGIRDIAAAIREYIASQPVVVAQGVMQFHMKDYGSLTNGNCVSIQLNLAAFDYEVIGIGVSYLGGFNSQGVYTTDDKLLVKLWNYTSNAQIGNTLELNNLVAFDNHFNNGDPIGANIALGNVMGVKICYEDTEGSTYPAKAIDFYLFVKPLQLQAP